MSTKPRVITIYLDADNHFSIHEGERVANKLAYDEMLGHIATIAHPRLDGRGRCDQHIDVLIARALRRRAKLLRLSADELIDELIPTGDRS